MSWAGLLGSVIAVLVNSDLAVVRAGLAQRRQSRPGADRRPGGGGLGRKLSPRAPRGPSFGRKNTGLSEASLQKTSGAQGHALIFPVGILRFGAGCHPPDLGRPSLVAWRLLTRHRLSHTALGKSPAPLSPGWPWAHGHGQEPSVLPSQRPLCGV